MDTQRKMAQKPVNGFREDPDGIDTFTTFSKGSGRSTTASNRLTAVLSTSYSDREIRSALEVLDHRKITNTPQVRRQLKSDIQKEVLDCNQEIVRDFGQTAEQLRRIGSLIARLNRTCQLMQSQLESTRADAQSVVKDGASLISERQEVNKKQQLISAFSQHFIITQDEINALSSSTEPVDDKFFSALNRAKMIHQDCRVLLGNEDQTLGLEVMEKSSKTLNSAFQKLYRHTQNEFKSLNLENPQMSASIRRALRILAERPTLFQSCLDAFADTREHVLSDAFHSALTGNVSSSADHIPIKPIEFYAHDPLRYVGDMLAWAHSTTVSEKEALESLFISEGDEMGKGIRTGLENEPWGRSEADLAPFDGREALNRLVNRDTTGIARILRQRSEQIIHGHEEPALSYKIANLLKFYMLTFQKLLGDDSALLDCLKTLEESALRQFRATMRDHVSVVQSEIPQVSQDLQPPDFFTEALDQLKVLLKSFDTSLAPLDSREGQFKPILEESLDPFLDGCRTLSKSVSKPRSDIFSLNFWSLTRECLEPFAFVSDRVTEIDDSILVHQANLIDYQHACLLKASGLHIIIDALSSLSDEEGDIEKIRNLPSFEPVKLEEVSQILDEFLPSALSDAMENLKEMANQRIAYAITEEAADRFAQDFELIEKRIIASDDLENSRLNSVEDEDFMALRSIFPRTSGEVRVLLS